MKQLLKPLGLSLLIISLIFGCKKKEDPAPVNQGELITTVRLIFTEVGTTNTSTFVFRDPDGEGPGAPTKFDQIMLDKNTTYEMSIELLDESKTPAENITEEVKEEDDEHLFVYTPTPANLMTVTITNRDANNLPVGLEANVVTGATATSSGKLKVQLRHQPPINNQRVKNGTPGPGSDDINIEFNVMIHN
jgi:hypothetical protein